MKHLVIQPGVAMAVLDFTREFSPSLVSLVGLICMVATMIAVIALRRYELEKQQHTLREHSTTDLRKAA